MEMDTVEKYVLTKLHDAENRVERLEAVARELYEALRVMDAASAATGEALGMAHVRPAALARYEREVGK